MDDGVHMLESSMQLLHPAEFEGNNIAASIFDNLMACGSFGSVADAPTVCRTSVGTTHKTVK